MDIEQFLKDHDIKNYKPIPQQPIDIDNDVWTIQSIGYLDDKNIIKEKQYKDIEKFVETYKYKLIIVRFHGEKDWINKDDIKFDYDAKLYKIVTRFILFNKEKAS